jgi:hypothetical protein
VRGKLSWVVLGAAWVGAGVGFGCGGDDGAGGTDSGPGGDAGREDAGRPCADDAECDDGVFCNGAESCALGGCVAGTPVECDDGIACTEDACDEAARGCASAAADADGDGSGDVACGGDDCDDADADVHPGADELCDGSAVDEDCDSTTFGTRDADADGAIDATCCNDVAGGDRACGTDCDDTRAGVSPIATEVCNGRDDDCDARIDEGVRITFYRDVDGDGFGIAGETTDDCSAPMGYAVVAGDCNDAARGVNPGVADGPPGACNGVDDDCSGGADEGCACVEPASRMCGEPAPGGGFLETGACTAGTELCTGGRWGTCVGAVRPSTELCMGAEDEDCDGETNEECPCEAVTGASGTTLSFGIRSADPVHDGLRFHFVNGNVALGPTPAWAEIEVRCAATGHLIRHFRQDVGGVEYFFHRNSTANWEVVLRVDSGHPDGTMLYVQISWAGGP